MKARDAVLGLVLALIGLLAYLTIRVMLSDGVTILVVVSFLLLAFLGVGVIGALTSPPRR